MEPIATFLQAVRERGASDLHLASGNRPTLRIDGALQPLHEDVLAPDHVAAMIRDVMTPDQAAVFDAEREIDFTHEPGDGRRFRVNAFTNRHGAALVMRAIPTDQPTLDAIGAPPAMRRLADQDKGLVLVTGPTGSGKSTTLAAMIHHINSRKSRHIITIEDPVEYIHPPLKSLINQREVGRDSLSFARALRSALREDPDVILVGEMRDYETIALALTAAETGHLVMGTLHTGSAAKSIDRIIDVFPAGDKAMVRAMLAGSLIGVIAQTLLRKKDGGGRIAAFEILLGTSAIRNLIRENKLPQIYSMMQVGAETGMQTLEDAVGRLIDSGAAAEEERRHGARLEPDGDDPQTLRARSGKGGEYSF